MPALRPAGRVPRHHQARGSGGRASASQSEWAASYNYHLRLCSDVKIRAISQPEYHCHARNALRRSRRVRPRPQRPSAWRHPPQRLASGKTRRQPIVNGPSSSSGGSSMRGVLAGAPTATRVRFGVKLNAGKYRPPRASRRSCWRWAEVLTPATNASARHDNQALGGGARPSPCWRSQAARQPFIKLKIDPRPCRWPAAGVLGEALSRPSATAA